MSNDEHSLDPGIREVVALLRCAGFTTTDSGDGVSKPPDERAFDVPHVFMRTTPEAMVDDAHRLAALLCKELGESLVPGMVQVSYDPSDGYAVLSVMGVNDARLIQEEL